MRSSEPSSSSCSAILVIHSYSTSGQDRGPCLGHTSDKTADVVPDVAEPAIKRLRPRLLGYAYDDFVDTVFWGAVVTGRVYDLSPRMQEKRNVRYAVAAELRRIVGEPVQMEHEMRQAA